jgi:hypothetical protein
MTLAEFRELARQTFGPDLEKMTPANVREFLDRLPRHGRTSGGRFQLNETKSSYEAILRDFFRTVLDLPPEEAVIPLWTLALELAYADLRDVIADQLEGLFASIEEPGDRPAGT